jgi:hypothetical protein
MQIKTDGPKLANSRINVVSLSSITLNNGHGITNFARDNAYKGG